MGDIGFESVGNAARIIDHGDRALRQRHIAIYAENARARDCQQDGGGTAIADAIVERSGTRDDGHFAFEAICGWNFDWHVTNLLSTEPRATLKAARHVEQLICTGLSVRNMR